MGLKKELQERPVSTVSILLLTLCAILTLIWALLTGNLPTTERIRNVIVKENIELLKKTDTCVRRCVDEVAEKVVVKLIIFRKEPAETRSAVYQEALEQTGENGYIFFVGEAPLFGEGYLTAENYWEEEWRLLTKTERRIVAKWFKTINEGKSLLSLLDMLLSNDTVARELSIVKSYEVKVGPEKEITCHITPYDKIGIIGGYIGELRVARTAN